jgi:hypothetical protein
MEDRKPVMVVFKGRRTGMGAYTQYCIFSLRKNLEITPHRTEQSRTGNHWRDIWWLLPGKYFIAWKDISNTGKHRCGYGCLYVLTQPFIRLKNGTEIEGEWRTEDYGTFYVIGDKRTHWQEVEEAINPKPYAIGRWKGRIPDCAKEVICECILPREYAY